MAVEILETFNTSPVNGPLGTGDAFPDFPWIDIAGTQRIILSPSAFHAPAGGVAIPFNPLGEFGLYRLILNQAPTVDPTEAGFTIFMHGDDFQSSPPSSQVWGVMTRTTPGSDSFYFSSVERRSTSGPGVIHYALQKYVAGSLAFNETYHTETLLPGILYERHVQSVVLIAGSGVNYFARVFTGWLDVATIKVSTVKVDNSVAKIDHGAGLNYTGIFGTVGLNASAKSEMPQYFVGNNLFGTLAIPDFIAVESESAVASLPYQGIRLQNKFNLKI